jgi:hypothetical protein
MARLVSVDLERPEISGPVILATRCHGMNIQVLNPKGRSPGYLLACERSYGQRFYDVCLHVGYKLGLITVGVNQLKEWLTEIGLLEVREAQPRPYLNTAVDETS